MLFVSGCERASLEETAPEELLIYCGTTMAHAIRELADLFEQREHCLIKIIKDGSGSLRQSIRINQVGDLFLPGSEIYIEKCRAEGMVSESKSVGFNRAVLIVAKGNPLHISADLNNFINGKYRTVLGAPESGSIGKETKEILSTQNMYDKAAAQALFLATDSKDIEKSIEENQADLTINWYAATLQEGKISAVDIIRMDDSVVPPHLLSIGLLETSHHPELARRYMALACSAEGQAVFARFGFGGINDI